MRRSDTTPGFSAQKSTDIPATFLPKKWYIVAKRRKRLQSGNLKMDSFNRSFDSSSSAESPGGLNQGFLLHPDNPIHSSTPSIIPDTPSPQPSKRRRSERKRRLNPEAVGSSSDELRFAAKPKSLQSSKRRCLAAGCRKANAGLTPLPPEQILVIPSPSVSTSPPESYLSAVSSPSSSVVELEAQVVDSPVAIPSAANRSRRWESLAVPAASSASPLPASFPADFFFSLTDLERKQLCGGNEEDLAAVTEILDSSRARLEQEQADEEFARYLQTQFDAEQASFVQQQSSSRNQRSVQHNPQQRQSQGRGLGRFLFNLLDPLEDDYEALLQFEEQQGAVAVRKLTVREIARFPTKKFQSGAYAGSPACNICLCEYASGEMLRTLPCLHSFHRVCIDRWLKDKPVCPVCRTDLTDSETQDNRHS